MDELTSADPYESNRPTYFEIVTALALLRFSERQVDAAVLEVGLGGRLDSTNVCRPLVSVITSISFDHTQQLGNTLRAIAGEKAGIIKPLVPVVSGVLPDEPREVVAEVARSCDSRLVQLGRDFDYRYRPPRRLELAPAQGRMDYLEVAGGASTEMVDLELSLAGASGRQRGRGTGHAGRAARSGLDRLGRRRANGPGSGALAGPRRSAASRSDGRARRGPQRGLGRGAGPRRRRKLLSGAASARVRHLARQGLAGMLRVLLRAFDEVIVTRYWENPRAAAPQELAALAGEISSASVHVAADPATAWSLARQIAGRDHLIAITGSFYIAAEMRAAMRDAGALDGHLGGWRIHGG